MNKEHFSLLPIDHSERAAFEIWHDRFVNEYNRSPQARIGHQLCLGTPQAHWDETFAHNVSPYWIKYKNRNIGFATSQSISFGSSAETAEQMTIVSDVYVDPKFRGQGILRGVLLTLREQGIAPILIDRQKLLDNASYYVKLGFKFATNWADQDLWIVSPSDRGHPEWWVRLYPEELESQVHHETE